MINHRKPAQAIGKEVLKHGLADLAIGENCTLTSSAKGGLVCQTGRTLACWLYGDVQKDEGFWYSRPLFEAHGLTDDELFWVPDENALCILWHVGHIAHREQCHFVRLIQGNEDEHLPAGYELFGTEWCSVEQLKDSIDSIDNVFKWVESVREASRRYISSLTEEEFHSTPKSACGLSVGHWIFITVAHGALHIGKIQVLRNMLKGIRDNPC